MSERHRILDVATACGLTPAKVCEVAYDSGIPIQFDATRRATRPAYPRQRGHREPAPDVTGWLDLPRRIAEARELPPGEDSYSADAVGIATLGAGTVHLCRWRDSDPIRLEALTAAIGALDGPDDDEDETDADEAKPAPGLLAEAMRRVDWWTRLGGTGPDAYRVDTRRLPPIAQDEGTSVAIGDLHVTAEGRLSLLRALGLPDLLGGPSAKPANARGLSLTKERTLLRVIGALVLKLQEERRARNVKRDPATAEVIADVARDAGALAKGYRTAKGRSHELPSRFGLVDDENVRKIQREGLAAILEDSYDPDPI